MKGKDQIQHLIFAEKWKERIKFAVFLDMFQQCQNIEFRQQIILLRYWMLYRTYWILYRYICFTITWYPMGYKTAMRFWFVGQCSLDWVASYVSNDVSVHSVWFGWQFDYLELYLKQKISCILNNIIRKYCLVDYGSIWLNILLLI